MLCKCSLARFAISSRGLLFAAALLTPLLTGCAQDDGLSRAAVRGTVTLDGKPLAAGIVRFIPQGETQGPAVVATVQNGAFELPEEQGPLVGSHRVEIDATDYYGFAIDDEAAFAENVEKNGRRLPKSPVPSVYNSNSSLVADIAADASNEMTFQLSTTASQTARR